MTDLDNKVTLMSMQQTVAETQNSLLDNFIPANTVLTVELDGSGNFTSFTDAINYLKGKWSNGVITLQIGEGTFNISDTTFELCTHWFNFTKLNIVGKNKQTSILNFNNLFYISHSSTMIFLSNLTIKRPNYSTDELLRAYINASVLCDNITLENGQIFAYRGGKISLSNNVTIRNSNMALQAVSGGVIHTVWALNLYCYNVNYIADVSNGGNIYFHFTNYYHNSACQNKIGGDTNITISNSTTSNTYLNSSTGHLGLIQGAIAKSQVIS